MTVRREFRSIASDLVRGDRGGILAAVALGWFLSFGVRFIFPAMLPFLRDAFAMSLSAAGFLISVLWLAYGFGQLPGGMIGDRIGARSTLVVSTLVSAITMVVVSASINVWTLFVATILFGLATAPYGPMRLVVLSSTFPDRDGTAIGLTFAVGNLGTTLLPIFASVLATYAAWQLGFGFVVPLFLVVAIGLHYYIPDSLDVNGASDVVLSMEFARSVLDAVADRYVLFAAGVSLFGGFVYQALTGLYPTYLVDIKGLSPTIAATLLGVFFASGMIYQIISGAVSDRIGTSTTLVSIFVLVCGSLAALPFVEGLVGLGLLTVLLSSMIGYQPVVQTYLTASLPEDRRGSGLGLLRTVAFMIGATGPVTVGVLGERGFFDEAFFGLAIVMGGALLLSARLGR